MPALSSSDAQGPRNQRGLTKPIILIDRSRIEARQNCPRLRYWNYHFQGKGLERIVHSLPLVTGIYVHEGLASLLKGESLDATVTSLVARYREEVSSRGVYGIDEDVEFFLTEQTALLAGLLAGWKENRLQVLLAEYDVVAIEHEFEWELAPRLHQMLRCDGLLRRKSDGLLFILEFKTVGTPGYAWQNQWEHNIQILSYTAAVSETRNEPVGGVMIEGLVKGYRRRETAQSSPFHGKVVQNSPFCYAFESFDDNGERTLSQVWSRKATKIQLPWQHWLSSGELPLLTEQFIVLPAISPLKEHIDRWRRQTIAAEIRWAMALAEIRQAEEQIELVQDQGTWAEIQPHWPEGTTSAEAEKQLRDALGELLDFYAPQHDNHCLRYGSPCSMLDLCFNPLVDADPIGSGLYKEREPHHKTEFPDAA